MLSPWTNTAIVFGVGAAVVVLTSCLGWILFPDLASQEAIIKEENEDIYSVWVTPPVPVTMQYYFFDCTNCNFTSSSIPFELNEKPALVQKGPFSFTEGRIKFGITENYGLLTYRENITYFYDPKDGEDSLTDTMITSPNPIYFTIMSLIHDADGDFLDGQDFYKEVLSVVAHRLLSAVGENPFMRHPVEEMLFKGWSVKPLVRLITALAEILLGVSLPPIEDPRFGYWSTSNGTNLGSFTIESGANDLNSLGVIRSWEGQTSLTYWNDSYCDMINGTDGAIYSPMVKKSDIVYIFTPDLCRSVYATYEKEVSLLGVKAYRFTIPESVFSFNNPENDCFIKASPILASTSTSGVLDLRPCLGGAPVMLSTPHFYLGSEFLYQAFEGLKPEKEWHETNFDLEPLTAAPVFASKKIQISIDTRMYSVPEGLLKMNNTIFPVFWINESAGLDQATADDLNTVLNLVEGVNIGRWCFLAAGIVLVLASAIMTGFYCWRGHQKKKQTV